MSKPHVKAQLVRQAQQPRSTAPRRASAVLPTQLVRQLLAPVPMWSINVRDQGWRDLLLWHGGTSAHYRFGRGRLSDGHEVLVLQDRNDREFYVCDQPESGWVFVRNHPEYADDPMLHGLCALVGAL